jgi:N-acetylated-alpha-linked acidic dipeptidase
MDFTAAQAAANRFLAEATVVFTKQANPGQNVTVLNTNLRAVEEDLLNPEGLPGRPWFRHTIFAPGEYTGYAAIVIPGVNEAIDAHEGVRAQAQLKDVTAALVRATATLEEIP